MKTLVLTLVFTASMAHALPRPANDDFENARQTIAAQVNAPLQDVYLSRPENRQQLTKALQDWFARPDSVQAPEIFDAVYPKLVQQARHVQRAGVYGGTHERIEILEILKRPEWRRALEARGYREKLRYEFPAAVSLIPAASDLEVARWMFGEEDLSLSEEFAAMAERLAAFESSEASWRFYDQFRGETSKLSQLSWERMEPVYQEKLLAAMKSGFTVRDDRSLFLIALKILPNDVLESVIDASSGSFLSRGMSWAFSSLNDAEMGRLLKLRSGKLLLNALTRDRYFGLRDHLKIIKQVLKFSNDTAMILQVLPATPLRHAVNSDFQDIAEDRKDYEDYLRNYQALLSLVYKKLNAQGASFSELRRVVSCMPNESNSKKEFSANLSQKSATSEEILSILHTADGRAEVLAMWNQEIPRLVRVLTGSRWMTIPGDFDRLPAEIVDRLYTEGLKSVKSPEDFLHITRALSEYPNSAVVSNAMRAWMKRAGDFYPSKVTHEQLEHAIKVYIGTQPSPMRPLVDALVKLHSRPMSCQAIF